MVDLLLSLQTPEETARSLAERCRALRLAKAWTRRSLADRAGVTEASLKRFESTGQGAIHLLLRVAFALGRLEDFQAALEPHGPSSMAELEALDARPARKRGRW
jgi:transcriptional regulator with XRE-family HTH domain